MTPLIYAGIGARARSARSDSKTPGLTPVVITHHAPSPRCIRPWCDGARLNPGFASDLDAVIARYRPPLRVHGHMHHRIDERLGATRVVRNPDGYDRVEGHGLDPAFVVEVQARSERMVDRPPRW